MVDSKSSATYRWALFPTDAALEVLLHELTLVPFLRNALTPEAFLKGIKANTALVIFGPCALFFLRLIEIFWLEAIGLHRLFTLGTYAFTLIRGSNLIWISFFPIAPHSVVAVFALGRYSKFHCFIFVESGKRLKNAFEMAILARTCLGLRFVRNQAKVGLSIVESGRRAKMLYSSLISYSNTHDIARHGYGLKSLRITDSDGTFCFY